MKRNYLLIAAISMVGLGFISFTISQLLLATVFFFLAAISSLLIIYYDKE